MKMPDRIVGVLDLNGTRFPFELMKDSLFDKCFKDNLHSIWAQQELYKKVTTL